MLLNLTIALNSEPHSALLETYVDPSFNTNELSPNLSSFLQGFYQKNYPDIISLKGIKSIQLTGDYYINDELSGTIKIIKKRPNKYKSHIKTKLGLEQIIIFNGEQLKQGERTEKSKPIKWSNLDLMDKENFWISYDKYFDSLLIDPNDPNKSFKLRKAFEENKILVQPIEIEHQEGYKITYNIKAKDKLIISSKIEIGEPLDPNYNTYSLEYSHYKKIEGIQFPRIITSKINNGPVFRFNFNQIKLNSGISNFIFELKEL